MEFLSDLKSRLSFRSPAGRSAEISPWSLLYEGDQFFVLEIDRSGLIRSANRALKEVRDANAGEVIDIGLLFLVHAEDRAALSELVRETMAGGAGGSVMARLLTGSDSSLPVRWTLIPEAGPEGDIRAVTCVGADLTVAIEVVSDRAARSNEVLELRKGSTALGEENRSLREALDEASRKISQLANEGGPIPGLDEDQEGPAPTLAQLERRYILHTLEKCRGRVSGAKGAAKVLGMHPNTLRSRMEKYGIVRMA